MSRVETIGNATLYLGDWAHIPATLLTADALVSDVPYGIKEKTKRATRISKASTLKSPQSAAKDWKPVHGDDRPFDPTPWLKYNKVILFGANHYSSRLPDASKWIVWDKREETGPDDNADCELIWTNLNGPARIHRQLWRGICRRGEENVAKGAFRLHPTQKPVALMDFCIRQCRLREGSVVLDPFMGSGTTGVAAVRLGLKFVGCEIDETYFNIACERIDHEQRQAKLFGASA